MTNIKYGIWAREHKQGIGREERCPIMIRPEYPPPLEITQTRGYAIARRPEPKPAYAPSQELLLVVSVGLLLAIVGTLGFAAFIL